MIECGREREKVYKGEGESVVERLRVCVREKGRVGEREGESMEGEGE